MSTRASIEMEQRYYHITSIYGHKHSTLIVPGAHTVCLIVSSTPALLYYSRYIVCTTMASLLSMIRFANHNFPQHFKFETNFALEEYLMH